jgi:hypothetical protein
MSRLFFLLLLLTGLSYAAVKEPVVLTLQKSYDSYGFVASDKELTIGASGVIWQSVSENLSSVVARVVVAKKVEGGYELAYRVFDDLSQDALPYPSITPKEGDRVIINHLYKRVLPIVPSAEAMKVAVSKYSDLDFVEPDLFAAYLSKNGIEIPNKNDFTRFCKKNGASLLYFGLNDGGRFVDCYSFVAIDKDKVMYGVQRPQLPFYSRIKEIDVTVLQSVFSMFTAMKMPFVDDDEPQEVRSSRVGNFYGFYKKMIRE